VKIVGSWWRMVGEDFEEMYCTYVLHSTSTDYEVFTLNSF